MKSRSLIVLLLVVAVLASVAFALHRDGGGALTDWLASLHGSAPRH